jgi:two-component system OmpR family response regulator
MRCLIVEDDDLIAADLASALTGSGFRIERVADGDSAWFSGGTEDYDLVILDLGLPRIDGLSVLKRWRAEGRSMPVLILTARGSWNERVEGIDAGADDYLPKPFRMEELLARARALVRRAAGRVNPLQQLGQPAAELPDAERCARGTAARTAGASLR